MIAHGMSARADNAVGIALQQVKILVYSLTKQGSLHDSDTSMQASLN